ncbi:NUDIX hydrolase [Flagellimonas eckloniae]|uniref:Hydrolase n=1 Tax=Flagellimonas eckloniae TaxID=346185 RepID=A0A0Q1H5K6_9FLAO|nr:NUDIX domain-containing protein [Allomuricauda eckloniae]KQC28839.1 hydrolase [Allomuricauda eckloniae]
MDELVDILDENGNFTGQTCLKSEAHQTGLFHPTVHVWFYTTDGKMLFQKRGKDKKTFPLLWDVSVAGHIGASEPIVEAAIREVEEEIGLKVSASDLDKIGIFKSMQKHSESLIDNEFHHTFLCRLSAPLQDLVKQESEVDDLNLFTIEDFKSKLNQNEFDRFVPHKSSYYKQIIAEVEQRL